jgi:hypothetical protein
MIVSVSAVVFSILSGIVILFQACLAAGLPWGAASMGGKYPGKYPPKMRGVAVLNMLILGFLAAIVLSRAGLLFPQLAGMAGVGIWVVVGFFALATVLNSITPSKIERIWAPVALMQLIASILVAVN